jgi:small nuclear ribonucleoprotein (snRNP)-like protein
MLGELPDQVVASLRGEPASVGVERPTRGVDTRVETPPSVGPSIEMVHVARSPHRVGKDWRALVTSARRLQAGDALRVETMAGRLAAIVVEVAGELPSDGEYRSDVVTRLVNAEAMQSLLDANPCTAELDALRLRTLLFRLPAVDVRVARVGSSATAIVAGGTPATMHSSTTRRGPTVEEQLDKRDAPSMLGLRCTTGSKVAITMRDGHRVVGRLDSRLSKSDGSFVVTLTWPDNVIARGHVPEGQYGADRPENITAIELARGDEEFGWSRPSKPYSLDDCQTGRTPSVKPNDGGWVEVTTREQAKALDGKLVEIDAKNVDAAWDTSNLHGQLKQCVWDTRTLRAGAHGPVLWGHFRPMGLRLRVAQESSKSDELPEVGRSVEIELANGETIRGVVSETKAESWRGVSVCVEGPEAVPTHHREDRRFCGRWYTGTNVMIDSDERRVSWRYMDSQTDSMRNPCVDIQMPTGASSFDELIEAAKRLTGLRVSMSTTLRGSSCERCCNTGILRGFTTPDRPCDEPSCIFRKLAAKSEGPKEWTVVGRCELLSEGVDLAASGSDTYAMQVVRAAKSLGDQARRSGMGADDDPVKWIEQHEGSTCGWSATYEFVLAQKDDQRIGFIVADYSEGPGRANGTAAVRLRDHRVFAGTAITVESVRRQWDGGKPIHPVAVHGERCRDMVVDRLVCGLRDGSIES